MKSTTGTTTEAAETVTARALGCSDRGDGECAVFVTQTIACMALATETRTAKIAAIAIDLLIKLMKVGAVHGTFPLTKEQAGLRLVSLQTHTCFLIFKTTLSPSPTFKQT